MFDSSNMGESALTSHMKGKKHCEQATSVSRSQSINLSAPSEGSNNHLSAHSTSSISKSSLDSMIVSTPVTYAEIRRALKVVSSKYSRSLCDDIGQLFKVMFPDSKVAESFSCAKTKSRYIIIYGLAPYFFQCLQDEVKANPSHVISYDESFNRVLHFCQIDFLVRLLHESKKHVVTWYLTSEFLQGAKADQLVNKFNSAVETLDQSKLIQIFSDGPSGNLKSLSIIHEQRDKGDQLLILIDIGTCGLHAIHGNLKNGSISSGWKIDVVLKVDVEFTQRKASQKRNLRKNCKW